MIKLYFSTASLLFTSIYVLSCSSTGQKKIESVYIESNVVPSESAPIAPAAVDSSWRSTRPPASPSHNVALPVFQRATLKNGLQVLVVENHLLPTVEMNFVMKVGSLYDDQSTGMAQVAYDVLAEGTETKDTIALSKAFKALGTTVGTTAEREKGWIGTQVLKPYAEQALSLIAEMVLKPRFAKEDVDRILKERLVSLEEKKGNPVKMGSVIFSEMLYGATHPYGVDAEGTKQSLEKITANQVKEFWHLHKDPSQSALILVGDITLNEATILAEKYFTSWDSKKTSSQKLFSYQKQKPQQFLFPFSPAAQSVVFVGVPMIEKGHPEELIGIVANEIFGGMFSSRLNMDLRERAQWTYGAYSRLMPRRIEGPWLIRTSVQAPNTMDAVVRIEELINEYVAKGPSQEELTLAIQSIKRAMPGELSSTDQQVSSAAEIFTYNLPLDYYTQRIQNIESVTLQQVNAFIQKYFKFENMHVLVVGEEKQVQEQAAAKKRSSWSIRTNH